MHESPELVSLLMQVDLDQRIPPQLYMAVAELLAWIYQLESASGGRIRDAGAAVVQGKCAGAQAFGRVVLRGRKDAFSARVNCIKLDTMENTAQQTESGPVMSSLSWYRG